MRTAKQSRAGCYENSMKPCVVLPNRIVCVCACAGWIGPWNMQNARDAHRGLQESAGGGPARVPRRATARPRARRGRESR